MPRPTPPTLPPAAAAIRQQAARYATPAPSDSVAAQRDRSKQLTPPATSTVAPGASLGSLAAPPPITINVAALQDAGRNRAEHLAGAMQAAAAPPPVPTQHRMREPEGGWQLRRFDASRRLPARELLAESRRWRIHPGDGFVIVTAEPHVSAGSTANVVTMNDFRLMVPRPLCVRAGLPTPGEAILLPLDTGRWAIIAAADLLPALAAIIGPHPAAHDQIAAAPTAQVIPITSKERTA